MVVDYVRVIVVVFLHQHLLLILERDQLNGLNVGDLVDALLALIYSRWDKVAHGETMAQL